MKKLFILFIAVAGFGVNSFGQSSATATATADLVTPISISKTLDMNFGTLASSGTAGTLILATDNSRTSSGGVKILTATTGQAATFTVTGSGTQTYSITLPSTDVSLVSGANSLIANTFTSNPTPTGTLNGGTQTLLVGATLNVPANQIAGTYVSSNFTVTVNYN